ncbi:hypothetical protein E2C01_000264 [Portunus trituberculatus]|uniref:Uncharacterized protein n=1 Tax=Portunus trituberculatus TaxID=210409 RepID=A0A5B7CDV2_PORTR|nr:hypothetical protein [Portunus trituberculatus]
MLPESGAQRFYLPLTLITTAMTGLNTSLRIQQNTEWKDSPRILVNSKHPPDHVVRTLRGF